ncbi:MAG: FAD-dependent thymidylate synthase [Romboutsia sp.]|nr:FAD-dependent thymidylate synthase [Romboutsia sp.]
MRSELKVKLISYTPNPDLVVASAAKLCYSAVGVDEIQKKLNNDEIDRFVNMLVSINHESPIEHVTFTFAVEGISRACSHQIVRHRIASFSQQSQRYVKLNQFEYIVPPEIEELPIAKERYIKSMEESQQAYNEIVSHLIYKYAEKEDLIKEYKEQYENVMSLEEYLITYKKSNYKAIEKKAIEDARYVFPNACETKMIFTMNARSLINFLHHRCCERAQWEIRELATAMLKELKQVAPILFSNTGPNCLNKPCPEGKMTCGKIKEVREKFKDL